MRATVYGPSSGLGAVEPEVKVDRTGVNNNNNIPQELPSIPLKHTHVASVDMLLKQSLFEPTALGLCMMSGACVHMSM